MKLLIISFANFYGFRGELPKCSQPSAAPIALSTAANLTTYLDVKVVTEISLNVNAVSV